MVFLAKKAVMGWYHEPKKRTTRREPVVAKVSRRSIASKIASRVFSVARFLQKKELKELLISANATEFAISPDENYVAWVERYQAYVMPFVRSGRSIEIAPDGKAVELPEGNGSWFPFGWQGVLATYTVTNTSNTGAGSLRQAITDANANAGADTIVFAIPGAGHNDIYQMPQFHSAMREALAAVVSERTR